MARYIEAEALKKHFPHDEDWDCPVNTNSLVCELIDKEPTADVAPVRHGRWIKNDNGTYSCSECQSWIPNEQHHYARYCLYCGAKMDK